MPLQTLALKGNEALATLESRRAAYLTTGTYPFLIGGDDELELLNESREFDERETSEIVDESLQISPDDWIAEARRQANEYGFSVEDSG